MVRKALGGALVIRIDVGRQGHMLERDHYPEMREYHLQGSLDQAELQQDGIDEAVIAEHDNPGIGT